MKLKILDINKIEKGSRDLPIQFYEPVRVDLIQRAILSIEASEKQPNGVNPRAGQRHTVWVSKRRRDYKGSYGHGISRVPRKVISRSGTQFNWIGAEMPGTVGGRVAHPPKASKIYEQKINETENRRAIRSSIAATMIPELIKSRGHRIPANYPFIIDSKIESIAKTKDVAKMLNSLGFAEELARTADFKIRAGKGKNRGRKYQSKVGPLFVVSKDCPLVKSARNVPGIQVAEVKSLNAKILAPGCHPGRLTIWSEAAIDALENQNLFNENYKGETQKKEIKVENKEIKKTSKPVQKIKTTKLATKKPAKKSE